MFFVGKANNFILNRGTITNADPLWAPEYMVIHADSLESIRSFSGCKS